ncbi:hypothetical protein VP01_3888g4 [Puccinia sorghi]|uniref:Uncharacterized protein n=1 Tax=Puccinia sorghi TaxID=27349 RepID=A0A0L6USY2_9BASI|nr:hypothetical protein VP01_3888g4 [Puccinia sorghi]
MSNKGIVDSQKSHKASIVNATILNQALMHKFEQHSKWKNLGGLIAGYGIWCNSKYQSQDCAYEARELSLELPFIEFNY